MAKKRKNKPEPSQNSHSEFHEPEHSQVSIGMDRGASGPKIIESKLSRMTVFSFNDWKEILKYEKRENVSHSILLNSLRKGIPNELRPRIWAFLCDLRDIIDDYVSSNREYNISVDSNRF